jgi:hypothetical protein
MHSTGHGAKSIWIPVFNVVTREDVSAGRRRIDVDRHRINRAHAARVSVHNPPRPLPARLPDMFKGTLSALMYLLKHESEKLMKRTCSTVSSSANHRTCPCR